MRTKITKRLQGIAVWGTLFACLSGEMAFAHGVNGHIWVSDGGIDQVSECDLAVWLGDEDIRAKLQIGAAFPDTGYAMDVGREYGETAHWEPFVQAYIEHLRETYGPPYDSVGARERIAFLFGLAGHGMEDEVFDTIFMRLAEELEGSDQSLLDPGTDFMLVSDRHTDLKPDMWLPHETLLDIYARPEVDVDVSREQMELGMFIVRNTVIQLVGAEGGLDGLHRPQLPWTAEHYLDPQTPGSFPYEKTVAGPYYDAMWNRLHGRFRLEDVVIQTVPAPGQRLLSTDHTSVQSRPWLVFGYGVYNASLTPDTVTLQAPDGATVPVQIAYTRWGSSHPDDVGRVLELRPLAELEPDAEYTVILKPGIRLVDGTELAEELRFPFRTACDRGASCPSLDAPEAAVCELEPPAPQPLSGADETAGCRSARADLVALLLVAGFAMTRAARRSSDGRRRN